MSKFTYILDPGHGGIDPKTQRYVTAGKRSPVLPDGTTYFEGVGNRQIAKLVGDELKAKNIQYAYTVTPSDHTDVSLVERQRRANALHKKKPCILISIHSNASGDGRSFHAGQGFEVFTSIGQTNSDKYAEIWYEEMKLEFDELKGRSDRSDGDHDKEARLAMVQLNCPSFLIEMAFHTHKNEVMLLKSFEGQKRFAKVIVRTIERIEKL
jgi:N-acetylmuramoyl-L-alanine amidase